MATKRSTTSLMARVFVGDSRSSVGAGLTGLVYNTSGLAAAMIRDGDSTVTAITLVTSTVGNWTSDGWKEIDATLLPGWYQFGVRNAALTNSGPGVTFQFSGAANMIPAQLMIDLVAVDPQDANAMGMARIDVATSTRLAPAVAGRALGVAADGSVLNTTAINGITIGTDELSGLIDAGNDYFNNGFFGDSDRVNAIYTAVTNLNNLSALANLYGPQILEIPDTSTTLYPFTLTVRDTEGHLVDLDASPTIAAANAAGTSRTANLSAVTHPATGRYTFTYSVAAAAAEEGLRISATGAVNTSARYIEIITAIANYDSITMLAALTTTAAAIKAKTDLLSVGGSGYIPVDILAVGGNAGRATILNILLGNYAVAGKLAATVASGDSVDAASAATSAAAAAAGIANITSGGAVKLPATPPSGYGAFSFSGSRPVTITAFLADGITAAQAAAVRITQGVSSQPQQTNISGHVMYSLDDGDYTLSITKGGYSFTPVIITVDASHTTFSKTLIAAAVPCGSDPDSVNAFTYTRDGSGQIQARETITYRLVTPPSSTAAYDDTTISAASGSDGLWTAPFLRGGTYEYWRDENQRRKVTIAVDSPDPHPLKEVIG